MKKGCGIREELSWHGQLRKTIKEVKLGLYVEGWVRAGWVEQHEEKIPSRGTGMTDVQARGGLLCVSWMPELCCHHGKALLHLVLCQRSPWCPRQTTAPIWAPSSSKTCGFDYNSAVFSNGWREWGRGRTRGGDENMGLVCLFSTVGFHLALRKKARVQWGSTCLTSVKTTDGWLLTSQVCVNAEFLSSSLMTPQVTTSLDF